MIDADKLRALDEAATPGNWQPDGDAPELMDGPYMLADFAYGFQAERNLANVELTAYLRNSVPAILAMAEEWERLEGDVQLWKRIANERSEQMQQLNLDRAAMGVENMRLREALRHCAECDPECAMFADRALGEEKA